MNLSLRYGRDSYSTIYIHALPKGTRVEVIDNPHDRANARDIKIGTITISIFEEEGE